jgi:hypothetical protein
MGYNFSKQTQVVYEVEIDEPLLSPCGNRYAYEAQLHQRYRFVWLSGLWKPETVRNWVKSRGENVKKLTANHVYFNNSKGGFEAVPLDLGEAV